MNASDGLRCLKLLDNTVKDASSDLHGSRLPEAFFCGCLEWFVRFRDPGEYFYTNASNGLYGSELSDNSFIGMP